MCEERRVVAAAILERMEPAPQAPFTRADAWQRVEFLMANDRNDEAFRLSRVLLAS